MPTRKDVLREGKSKILYTTDDPNLLIQEYKDAATAFNGVKKGVILDKGVFNCQISSRIFRILEQSGIETHLVEDLSDREQLVRSLGIIPVPEPTALLIQAVVLATLGVLRRRRR